MIKTYNPKETPKWMGYAGLLIGITLIIWGILNNRGMISALGLFFILVVSHKLNIFIGEEGLLMETTILYWIKKKEGLNFKEMDSIEIKRGQERSMVVFWKGCRGRRVLINTPDLDKLLAYVSKENPDLIRPN